MFVGEGGKANRNEIQHRTDSHKSPDTSQARRAVLHLQREMRGRSSCRGIQMM
jgi:hypothetical protein